MKEYMKPTIAIAAATGTNVVTCIEKIDAQLIFEITGIKPNNMADAFGMYEACDEQLPIEFWCKFTSADLSGVQAFIS